MSYYNRKRQLYETLKSINKSKFRDFEVIIVDDCSFPEHRVEEFETEFSFLNVVRINEKDKWYVNSCVPYNIGFRAVRGEIVVIQNPECIHVQDVLTHINEYIDENTYISISAYAVNHEITKNLPSYFESETIGEYFKTLPQRPTGGSPIIGWYNHSKYRPTGFHFCSAITKNNLDLLNGFDERYAYGIAYDDNEFLERVRRLGLKVVIPDNVSVIHQYHDSVYYNLPDMGYLHEKNKRLFNEITKIEKTYRAN